ncbi:MAG: tRNA (adenosine(37)-N6)-threonylcarbamoyltransferase complex transferase subunit TsaD [Candidatus Doudnabacteria bacterium]|nr:tRNA (adenosine(37)-N6)-threonylcarbamoyltransferase complex transferase subunit TsaD [Candidatus Doudnabacteria bacterium]
MPKNLTILAIETSCDETAAAIIKNGKIVSNIIASQAKLHAKYGGVVPEVAARSHITAIIPTINLALKQSKTKLTDLDYIAVTQGPGLMTSLMVGIDTAKALGEALNIPVIPINHLEAHIYANYVKEKGEGKPKGNPQAVPFSLPSLPALILIVSGGHTLLVEMRGHTSYRILGETVDDAAGEAFDKTAKMLKLGYPGGPQISKLAQTGNAIAYNFPRPMIGSGNFEFSFSGLKTAVLYKIQELKSINSQRKADIAASLQQAIIDTLIAKLEKAIVRYKPKTIMLGGGVAANALLRQEFQILASKYRIQSSIPAFEYCTDNAGMIGLAAYYRLQNKKRHFRNFTADPNLNLK